MPIFGVSRMLYNSMVERKDAYIQYQRELIGHIERELNNCQLRSGDKSRRIGRLETEIDALKSRKSEPVPTHNPPEAAKCHVCGKKDFVENMIVVQAKSEDREPMYGFVFPFSLPVHMHRECLAKNKAKFGRRASDKPKSRKRGR